MNNKAFILALYFVALFIILKNYYKNNSGMPYPTTVTAPSYLYAVLGLTSDFTGGLSTVLAAGLTLGLFYRTHNGNDPIPSVKSNVTVHVKDTPKGTTVKAPTKPGTNP